VVDCPNISCCYNTRGFVIHWCIEVVRQQGTLPFKLPLFPDQR
jgi:hypothetical protein